MVVYAAPAEGYTETGSCGSSAYWYYYEDTNTFWLMVVVHLTLTV